MRGFRVWSDYWKKYATEAELYMDGSADAVFEDAGGVPHHENTDLVVEFKTGLKDKNGKEIYMGDILGDIWGSGFISWCEKCKQPQYHSVGIGCMACSGDVPWYDIAEDDGKLEVIGNIHENRELLEREEE